jgi:hypothetical protein
MTIHTTNLLNIPLLVLLWLVDGFLLLSALRLLLRGRREPKAVAVRSTLSHVTDPIPRAVHGWLSSRRTRPTPFWLSWLLVVSAAVIVRYLLAWLIVAIL